MVVPAGGKGFFLKEVNPLPAGPSFVTGPCAQKLQQAEGGLETLQSLSPLQVPGDKLGY